MNTCFIVLIISPVMLYDHILFLKREYSDIKKHCTELNGYFLFQWLFEETIFRYFVTYSFLFVISFWTKELLINVLVHINIFYVGHPSLCHFFCPSIVHHILGTVHHQIIIFGIQAENNDICRHFFNFYKILIFWVFRE